MVLLVAFSFVHKNGPSRCNRRIANAVLRITDAVLRDGGYPVLIVAQSEVYEELYRMGLRSELLIEVSYYQTLYSGSGGVVDIARDQLITHPEIKEIILVANPRWHLRLVRKIVRREYRDVKINSKYEKMIGRIGYDHKADNTWARSPLHLLFHTIRLKRLRKG